MLRFDDDRDATRLNLLVDRLGDLRGQALLNLQPASIHVDQPRNLAQADHPAVRDIPDMTLAEKREQMMLAQAEQLDIPDDDHFVIRNIEERFVQDVIRIHPVTARKKTECTIDPCGSVLETVACGVLADL